VQTFLIPDCNQVGAMSESLGFPVLPGHAHPLRMMAPYIFYSRGTRCIYHAQSRGTCSLSLLLYYIPERKKNGKEKNEKAPREKHKKLIISVSYIVPED
jgi:hypothetical protein